MTGRSPAPCSRRFENTDYFDFRWQVRDPAELDKLIRSGTAQFGVEIPASFERDVQPRRSSCQYSSLPMPLIPWLRALPSPACMALSIAALRRELRGPDEPVEAKTTAPFEITLQTSLQSGGHHPGQYRAGPARRRADHDHDDVHGARRDARDRARHHGEPACHADQAGRDHDRQDRAVRARRLRADGDHPDGRALSVRCADLRQCVALNRAVRRCSPHRTSPSATRSPPSRRISSRRCR